MQVIGMIHYLTGLTRSDLEFITHRCSRFSENLKVLHELAVRKNSKYLPGTKDRGIIFEPDKDKGIECYIDADFAQKISYPELVIPYSMLDVQSYGRVNFSRK